MFPAHLLFPLFSSVCFVCGMMLVKQGIQRGASPWTGTFCGNMWVAAIWLCVALWRGHVIPLEAWPAAIVIGLLFLLGQVCTYLAYEVGDVSVATPVFGTKVLMVAALMPLVGDERASRTIWLAGSLACCGIVLIQWASPDPNAPDQSRKRLLLPISLALLAAFFLSLFDVALQHWASDYEGADFLPVMFGASAVFTLVLWPKVTPVATLKANRCLPWLLLGTLLMALQAMSMCFSLAQFGDPARVNIVYALRGLWGVLFAWLFATMLKTNEANAGRTTMLRRLAGAILLTSAVVVAINPDSSQPPQAGPPEPQAPHIR